MSYLINDRSALQKKVVSLNLTDGLYGINLTNDKNDIFSFSSYEELKRDHLHDGFIVYKGTPYPLNGATKRISTGGVIEFSHSKVFDDAMNEIDYETEIVEKIGFGCFWGDSETEGVQAIKLKEKVITTKLPWWAFCLHADYYGDYAES